MDATPRFLPNQPSCPLCGRTARLGLLTELVFVDCRHCSTYLIDEDGWRSLIADPLPPAEVASIASYNWEWSPCYGLDKGLCSLTAVNVRAMGRLWQKSDHHRFCQVLLRVLHNTHHQRPFVLEFDDPMYLGMTASTKPEDLRDLVVSGSRGHYLPIIEDHGRAIRTYVSDHAMTLMSIPLSIAPGIAHAFNLRALRKQVA
jgi:hypothetical protein